jgi:hypothetical protein
MYKYTSSDLGRTWTKAASPFYFNAAPSNHPCHVKLQSGRILQTCFRPDGRYIFGESVDQGKTWFCRRLSETGGYSVITQTRDGLIHVCGDMDNRPGGAFIQLTFSEQWLREGTCLATSQWAAPNPPADQVSDCSGTEPAYFDTLYTPAIRVSGSESSACLDLLAAPNPFNPSTLIRYSLPGGGQGGLSVFNAKGAWVRGFELNRPAGSVSWDGSDQAGRPLPSGIYFTRLSAGQGKSITMKVFYLK